jgi:hypothetical protein
LRPGEGIGQQGTIDAESILFGDWSYVGAISGGTEYELGNVPEGVGTVSREQLQFQSTAFPKLTSLIVDVSVGMMFEGNVQEIHSRNLHLLIGDAVSDSPQYIYVGDRKDCTYFTFSAKRERVCDGRTIEWYQWKCKSMGLVQIGAGGTDGVRVPFQFVALADIAGDFGGSAQAPLGYIFLPVINT